MRTSLPPPSTSLSSSVFHSPVQTRVAKVQEHPNASSPLPLPGAISCAPVASPAQLRLMPTARARGFARAAARVLMLVCFVLASLLVAHTPARAQDADGVHIVARGEGLIQIARRYGVSVSELISYNNINDPNHIYTGQRLLIPGLHTESSVQYGALANAGSLPAGNGYYTVRQGDTLSQIAQRFNLTTDDLMRLNGLTNASFIWVGQQLRLSARVEPGVGGVDQTEPSDIAGNIYVVQPGDTLSQIARTYNTTVADLLAANGLPDASFIWYGQRLRIKSNAAIAEAAQANAPIDGKRWIEVDLTTQMLTAWQGDVAIMHTSISSGLPGTPTVTGRYQVGIKYQSQRMTGPGYDLPGVPWVMYFYGDYAIHGAYWHTNFGVPMSRGCVNMVPSEAEFLYNWAPVGTEVYVHY